MIERLKEGRVLVVGDVMLDKYTYGDVTRISPEAPVPICQWTHEESFLGGAGNVVANLVALGVKVDFVSVVGSDFAGNAIKVFLKKLPRVKVNPIMFTEYKTTVKHRFISRGQQLLRVDTELDAPLNDFIFTHLRRSVRTAMSFLDKSDVVIFSDYGKGVVGYEQHLSDRMKFIVDPKGPDWERYSGAYLVTPNLEELAVCIGAPIKTEVGIVAAAKVIQKNCGILNVLVTRGAEGMTLVTPDTYYHIPAFAQEIFDVTGAGDTVVAVMGAALAVGIEIYTAALLANKAAGIVVGRVGTSVVKTEELA